MTSRLARFYDRLLSYRIVVLIATVLVTVLIGSGMGKLAFSNDYRDFFPADDENLLAFEQVQDTFVRTNNVFVAVRANDGNIFTPDGLTRLADLTNALWSLPHVERVESLANHQFIQAGEDTIAVTDMVTLETTMTAQQAAQFRQMSLAEVSVNGLLASDNAAMAGINILISDAGVTELGKAEFMAALTPLLAEIAGDDFTTHMTGSIVIDHGFDVAAQGDLEVLYAGMYLLVLILAGVLTRSVAATFGVLLLMTCSWMIALGGAAYLGVKLTAISVAAPTVLMTLSVAQAMHIVFGVQKAGRQFTDRRAAVASSMVRNTVPLCLVAASTGIGFLAIMWSEVPPLRDLGMILTFGMIALLVLSLTFLPAFLSFFALGSARHMRRVDRQMIGLGRFVAGRTTALAVGFGALALCALAALPLNRINDNFIEYFSAGHIIRTDAMAINADLTGVHHAYIRADAISGSVFDPEYLAELDEFGAWLETQPNVRHVTTYADTLKRLNMALNADDEAAYALPDTRTLAVELNLLHELSLPFGQSTESMLSFDRDAAKVTIVLDNLDSSDLLILEDAIQGWIDTNASTVAYGRPTGPMSMFAHIGQSNARALLWSTLLAFAAVSVLLMIALRSVKLGLISLIPNTLPALLAFGIWGMMDGQVGLAVSIVTVMTFGIVVDDTVFLMTRFREHMRPGDFRGTLIRTLRDTGRPVINTTIILVAGFSLLAFSSFRLNEGLGILTALVMALALACDLLLLPAVLRRALFGADARSAPRTPAVPHAAE